MQRSCVRHFALCVFEIVHMYKVNERQNVPIQPNPIASYFPTRLCPQKVPLRATPGARAVTSLSQKIRGRETLSCRNSREMNITLAVTPYALNSALI